MAAKPGILAKLSGTFEQFFIWGVLMQVASAILAPVTQGLQQLALKLDPNTPLSPADAADAAVRGHWGVDQAAAEALLSGVNGERFDVLRRNAGEPPGIETLLAAGRRALIPVEGVGVDAVSVEQGIRDGRIADKWAPMLQRMTTVPIGVSDAVDAVVENQIDYAAGEHIAFLGGVSAADFRILVNTRGNPPSPVELQDWVRRGLIPVDGVGPDVLSLTQGISEGATKDKWISKYVASLEVLPPPRTVTALLRNGSIDDAKALQLFRQAGLSEEMAAAYVADAHHQKTASDRELAKSDVVSLYEAQIVTGEQAGAMLSALGYSVESIGLILGLADFRREAAMVNQAIARIRALYVARKLAKNSAITALDKLGVPASQRDHLIQTWALERGATIRVLTVAEIVSAVKLTLLSADEGLAELAALGYQPLEAWIVLSVGLKGPATPSRPSGALPEPYTGD
jgi:hypothetical protein